MTDKLVLTLDFETPLRARELGELFTALARDYKDLTGGRVLVVARLETGSLKAHLQDLASILGPYVKDAVEYAKAVKALADFAKLLKGWFGKAKAEETNGRLYRKGRKTAGQRSVEKMLDIAAGSRSTIRIKLVTPDGETIEAEMTPSEAVHAKTRALARKSLEVERERVARLPATLETVHADVRKAIGVVYDAKVSELSASEIQALVETLVSVLQAAGLDQLIEQIATDLAGRGLYSLAAELRARTHKGGTFEPPVTTS